MTAKNGKRRADTVVVLDFETTGLSPGNGDRAIEIGAVRMERGIVTERFQELMNPGFRISGFIQSYTGITNEMLKDAPPCGEVMGRFAAFIGDDNLVAHNASFDRRFLVSEFEKIGRPHSGQMACSMLISRRIFQDSPNHKLGSLVDFLDLETDGTFHRALADSEMTARLWMALVTAIRECHGVSQPTFSLMQILSRTCKAAIPRLLAGARSPAAGGAGERGEA